MLKSRNLSWINGTGKYNMHPDTNLVIQVQSLDQKITALEKEVAALPKHIAVIEKTLESHLKKLEADKAALAANQKERKAKDVEIQTHEQKISKLKDQMLGAKNNEQYRAFQNEIDFAAREIRKAEDRILELMGESEPLDANVKKAEAALKEEKQHVEAEKTQARERTAADQAQLSKHREARKEALATLSKPTVAAYEKIRRKSGNVIAEVEAGRCTACQIQLRPQYFQELRRGDHLMFCDFCYTIRRRILRTRLPVTKQKSGCARRLLRRPVCEDGGCRANPGEDPGRLHPTFPRCSSWSPARKLSAEGCRTTH